MLGAVPLGLLLVAAGGLALDDSDLRDRVVSSVFDNVPLSTDQDREQLEAAVTEALQNAGDLGVFPVVLLLFAATGLMASLRHAINEAWDIHERPPLVRRKLLDLALVVLAIGVIAVTVWIPGVRDLPFVFTAVTLAFLYRVLPMQRPRLRDVIPGAVVAAALISLVRELLELYFERFADMGAIYGSLGAMMAFLLFVFAASNIVVYGAEFASEYQRSR
jgi:membrane protein